MNITSKTQVDSCVGLPRRTFLGISLGALASLMLSACSFPQFSRGNESEPTTNNETKNLRNKDALIIGLNIALYCNSVTSEDEKSGTKRYSLTQNDELTNISFNIKYNDLKEVEQIVLYKNNNKDKPNEQILIMQKLYEDKNNITYKITYNNANSKKSLEESKVSKKTFQLNLKIGSNNYAFLHDGNVNVSDGTNNSTSLFVIRGDNLVYNAENIYGGFSYSFILWANQEK